MKQFIFILILLGFISCKHRNETPTDDLPKLTDNFKDQIPQNELNETIDFVLIGDWGYQSDELPLVSDQISFVSDYLGVDFMVTLGDNFYEYGVDSVEDEVWDVYLNNFNQASLQIPWYVSLGNHDHFGNVQAQIDYSELDDRWTLPSQFYAKHFPIPGGTDTLGLLVLDTDILKSDPNELGQIDFIDNFLLTDDSKWKFVVGHHPLYSYGEHGESPVMKDIMEDRLYENEVDLYISGHDHDLQHIKTEGNTHFFISGSAAKLRPTNWGEYSLYSNSTYGFMLIRLSETSMKSYFIDSVGNVLYTYEIEK